MGSQMLFCLIQLFFVTVKWISYLKFGMPAVSDIQLRETISTKMKNTHTPYVQYITNIPWKLLIRTMKS